MRKETGKLSEKIRQIQKGNKEEIVEVINQFDPLIKVKSKFVCTFIFQLC